MMTNAPPLVFVVEDQLLVQMSLEEGLQEAGYDVIVAANRADATGTIAAMGDRISGLITNVHLGGEANGWDVARRSRDLGCTFPVIYTTAGRVSDGDSEAVSNSLVVPRPFWIEQIVTGLSVLLVRVKEPVFPALPG
jgi:DNA-binding response OmpR family regulator